MILTDNARIVIERRIVTKNDNGEPIETAEEMFRRVANNIAEAERLYGGDDAKVTETADKFYKIMEDLDFLPNSPTLVNAGKSLQQLSACFVLPVEDSIDGIFKSIGDAARIHKTGGGTGFSFSRLRPNGSFVKETSGVASGPVSFMRVFDSATAAIKQGGTRRGANMGILSIDHPDIREFIHAKDDLSELNNFNISVAVTDEFMEKLNAGDNESIQLWSEIISSAHRTGDPGVIFIDRINASRANPVPDRGPIEATNPCVTGDTIIQTVYGAKTFKELAESGDDVLVHAWHPEKNEPVIRIMRRPHMTQKDAEIIKVTFDSGLEVKCTPNHSFWKFRGCEGMNKIEAQELAVGDSVKAWSMSKHRDGHIRVHGWKNGADHKWVARMLWESINGAIPDKMVVHHIDHNPENNALSNLSIITEYEHQSHHYEQRFKAGFHNKKMKIPVNHKVTKIEYIGREDVYNGMVEDAHTYIILDPTPVAGVASGIVSANCGEQPLYPYDSCNLGSINLSRFVIEDGDTRVIDYPRLADVAMSAVHFLDNVIDMTKSPLPEIDEVNKSIRRIGLGVMGFADMLIKLNLKYDSEEAIEAGKQVMQTISTAADKASIMLGMKRGNFPDFERSIYPELGYPALRNSTRTTIAPTGTISIIAGASSGIEPVFAFRYTRSHYLDKADPNKRTELEEFYEGYEKGNPIFVSANEIEPIWHIRMQAAFQEYTDNAVSKTINLPSTATKEEVEIAYLYAYKLGCKGITVYRDGCRENQVLTPVVISSTGRNDDYVPQVQSLVPELRNTGTLPQLSRRKLDSERNSITKRFTVGDFEGYITVGLYPDGGPGEVFIIGNKVGSSTRGYLDTIGSLISYSLQAGYSVNDLGSKFAGTRFEPSGLTGDNEIPVATSIVDYVFRYLKNRFGSKQYDNEELASSYKSPSGNMCPECDDSLYYGEGCETCMSCGYSKCG